MKILEFKTKEEEWQEQQTKLFKDTFAEWMEYEDLEEVVIIGTFRDGGFRYHIPGYTTNNIFLVGALEYMKGIFIGRATQLTAEVAESEDQ